MGNRAAVTFKNENVSVYLHWNGGRSSVEAMLDACKELQIRSDEYGPARFCQVVGNWFGGTMSLGIGPAGSFDEAAEDHGVYYVENWAIVSRDDEYNEEQDREKYEAIKEQLLRINRPIFGDEYNNALRKLIVYRRAATN